MSDTRPDSDERLQPHISVEHCSIAGALDALGDDWSVLVLRELFFGVRRFNEIQEHLGISRSVLTERLARLVDLGVVRVAPYREPGQRERNEYRLTLAGVGLLPVMVALMQGVINTSMTGTVPWCCATATRARRCRFNSERAQGFRCNPTR